MASCSPVEAPEGTAARPSAPPSRTTSASTVGLPRESMICLPCTRAIFVDMLPPDWHHRKTLRKIAHSCELTVNRKPLARGDSQLLTVDCELLLTPVPRSW